MLEGLEGITLTFIDECKNICGSPYRRPLPLDIWVSPGSHLETEHSPTLLESLFIQADYLSDDCQPRLSIHLSRQLNSSSGEEELDCPTE